MFAGQPVDYELIFVNDASTDRSLDLLLGERERNPRVKVLNLSRRFGVAEGVLAGMAAAGGDAVVYMDADLQDPPEVIPESMLARWRAGADVVHTVRTRRHGESPTEDVGDADRRTGSSSSDRPIELPVDAGDFKLLSRQVVDHLLQLREVGPVSARTRRLARLQPGVRHLRARCAARRPHAFPVLQPQSVEDVRSSASRRFRSCRSTCASCVAGCGVVVLAAPCCAIDARRRDGLAIAERSGSCGRALMAAVAVGRRLCHPNLQRRPAAAAVHRRVGDRLRGATPARSAGAVRGRSQSTT